MCLVSKNFKSVHISTLMNNLSWELKGSILFYQRHPITLLHPKTQMPAAGYKNNSRALDIILKPCLDSSVRSWLFNVRFNCSFYQIKFQYTFNTFHKLCPFDKILTQCWLDVELKSYIWPNTGPQFEMHFFMFHYLKP